MTDEFQPVEVTDDAQDADVAASVRPDELLEPAAARPDHRPTDEQGTDDGTDAFGDGPGPGLDHDARIALVTLMTQRFITRAKHPAAWDALLAYEDEIRERLDDLFLSLEVDRTYEVAFKRQVSGDGIPVLLRRDRALSRDASLLLIHLRQEHAYNDALDDTLVVSRDQVADFLNRFSPPGAHDQVQLDRRVDAAVRALEQYHLVEADPDSAETLVVSPAVVPLVTTEVLIHLRDAYREAAGRALGQPLEGDESAEAADHPAAPDSAVGTDSPEAEGAPAQAPTQTPTAPSGDVDA